MSSEQTNQSENPACGCSCDVCYCGPNCRCTETLCRCEASSMLNSLNRSASSAASSCCSGNQVTQSNPMDPLSTPLAVAEIGISGMTCSMCTSAVDQGLRSLEGVVNVNVSLATHSACIEFDSTVVEKGALIDLIEAIGYEAVVPEVNLSVVEFSISGMTCSMCSMAIQAGLDSVPGVHTVSVSLSTNSARVEYDSSLVIPDTLKEAIEDIGYECSVIAEIEESVPHQDRLEILLQQQQEEVGKEKQAFSGHSVELYLFW